MTKNIDFSNYDDSRNMGKMTSANLWNTIQNKEVEFVTGSDDGCGTVELDENTTIAKAWKAIKAKYEEVEKDMCTVSFYCKYEEYDETVYTRFDFDLV